MTSKRDLIIHLIRIEIMSSGRMDNRDEQQDLINYMKQVVQLNPELNADERNLLSFVYKSAITSRRTSIHRLNEYMQKEDTQRFPERVKKVQELSEILRKELEDYCTELVTIVTDQLLPITSAPDTRVHYEKLAADYLRYIAEVQTGTERTETAESAKQHYDTALAIAKTDLPPSSPLYLGLALNYSVLLYDILERRAEAIELATKTYNEALDAMDQMSEGSFEESRKIANLLRENRQKWNGA